MSHSSDTILFLTLGSNTILLFVHIFVTDWMNRFFIILTTPTRFAVSKHPIYIEKKNTHTQKLPSTTQTQLNQYKTKYYIGKNTVNNIGCVCVNFKKHNFNHT